MTKSKHKMLFILLALFLSGAYLLVFSESGVLERMRLRKDHTDYIEEINRYKAENERLSRLLEQYKRGELTRRDLMHSGLIAKNEKILFLKDSPGAETLAKTAPVEAGGLFGMDQLRVVWIAASTLILVLFYLFRPQGSRE